MASPHDLLHDAMKLPEDERTSLALRLLDSVDPPDPLGDLSDEEWDAEISRRAQAAKSGESNGATWEEVRQRLERKLGD